MITRVDLLGPILKDIGTFTVKSTRDRIQTTVFSPRVQDHLTKQTKVTWTQSLHSLNVFFSVLWLLKA